jgi:hypothetical protein
MELLGCYKLLALATCKKITSAISNYWWGSDVDRRDMHRKSGRISPFQRTMEGWDYERSNNST